MYKLKITILMLLMPYLVYAQFGDDGAALRMGVFAAVGSSNQIILNHGGALSLAVNDNVVATGTFRIDTDNLVLIASVTNIVGQGTNSMLGTFVYEIAGNQLFIGHNNTRWVWIREAAPVVTPAPAPAPTGFTSGLFESLTRQTQGPRSSRPFRIYIFEATSPTSGTFASTWNYVNGWAEYRGTYRIAGNILILNVTSTRNQFNLSWLPSVGEYRFVIVNNNEIVTEDGRLTLRRRQ